MNRMRRTLVGVAALSLCAAGLFALDGCTIINGLVVPVDAAAVVKTDGPAGETGAPDAGDGCDHILPPAPPIGIPMTTDTGTIVVVMKELFLATKTGATAIGYDLDRTCTSSDRTTESCIGSKGFPDPGGRGLDNNGGVVFNIFNNLGTVGFNLEERANMGIAMGSSSILIKISGFNGMPDDPEISVSLYASPGLFDPPNSNTNRSPQFLESEAWALDEAQFSLITPDLPLTTARGYVAQGEFVAELDATIGISESFSMTLNGGVITGVLDFSGATGPTPTIKRGVIAGRWPASDMLRVIARQRTTGGGATLCDDPKTYQQAKGLLCPELDLSASSQSDNKVPRTNCDAISASILFNAGRARLGAKRPVPPDDPCPDFPADDCKGDGG